MKKFLIIICVIIALAVGGLFIYKNYNNSSLENNVQNNSINIYENEDLNIDVDINTRLFDVMNSCITFIDSTNNRVMFNEYKISNEEKAVPSKYAYVDLDNDGIEELVVLTTSDYGAYIILKYQDNNIYGHMIGIRSFEKLKVDGSFIGSSGANNNEYLTITFNENKYSLNKEAVFDENNQIYQIKGKGVTKDEINTFVEEWNKKENVKWIEYNK